MYGYVKTAAAIPLLKVADCRYNIEQIEGLIRQAAKAGVQIAVFPELSITGYTCMDLFAQQNLIHAAQVALLELVKQTADVEMLSIVGIPLPVGNKLFNTAVAFQSGQILGFVPKTYLPNYKEFQETRWFMSANELPTNTVTIGDATYPVSTKLLFTSGKVALGIELCEDLWAPVPPSSLLALEGANVIANLSASNELTGKNDYLRALIQQQSARCIAGYVYASAGYGESSTDLVFAGKGFIAENGVILAESQRFEMKEKLIIGEIDVDYLQHDRQVNNSFMRPAGLLTSQSPLHVHFNLPTSQVTALSRHLSPTPFVPDDNDYRNERCEEIFNIQVHGLAKRLEHVQSLTAIIGVSGGLDSTLALLVTARAFDALALPRKQIVGITMPGFGTSERTYKNAVRLMQALGVTWREIAIREACNLHFKDIGHDENVQNVTYENTQARERMQILMDVANMENGIVVGTGDLSELALGWTTYNGDHMSMYNVNVGVPKTLVKYLVEWVAKQPQQTQEIKDVLLDVVDTPISPELIQLDAQENIGQKTEELIGPYLLHDFFLYHFIRFGAPPAKIYFLAKQAFQGKFTEEMIKKWLRVFLNRFFAQQYKRSCLPDGPKVGAVSLSPRCDWRMPSDARAALWVEEVEKL